MISTSPPELSRQRRPRAVCRLIPTSREVNSGRAAPSPPTWALVTFAIVLAGCGQDVARFEPNLVYMRSQKLAEKPDDFSTARLQTRIDDIQHVLTLFFGTPDAPALPTLEGVDTDSILNPSLIRMASGSSEQSLPGDQRGLFREHCARCHGLSGSGTGPSAARLNPYPRDYRRGIFKFKRTASTLPPTDEDLHNVLVRGVPGTAMPSFRSLSVVQREALVQYVRYLSIRGLYERALIEEVAFELGEDELLLDPKLEKTSSTLFAQQWGILESIATDVFQPWLNTDPLALTPPPAPPDYGRPESIARGRELFFTTLTNCATCHGDTALGDGQTEDYDEWGKELEPTSPEALKQYLALGALPPRKSQPRNLHDGIYRGGHRAGDLFVKVRNGIAGTTMPNVAAQLSDDDIWHLVAYTRYIPFDPISHPAPPAGAMGSEPEVGQQPE